MADEYTDTASFRGATFTGSDLGGATFRECDLRGVRVVGSIIDDLHISAFAGRLGTIVIEGIDVKAYVNGQLDRQFPELKQVRNVSTADEYRAMGDTVETIWAATLRRAEQLPEAARHQRVDGEWSVVETLRHLVFAIDVWVGRMVLAQPAPYHPLGLPPTDSLDEMTQLHGLDIAAEPSYDVAKRTHAERQRHLREVLHTLNDDQLTETRTADMGPGWGVETHSVGDCLRTALREHCEHRRYAERDLATLETVTPP